MTRNTKQSKDKRSAPSGDIDAPKAVEPPKEAAAPSGAATEQQSTQPPEAEIRPAPGRQQLAHEAGRKACDALSECLNQLRIAQSHNDQSILHETIPNLRTMHIRLQGTYPIDT